MKIRYRFVHNRKKQLNAMGEALVQIEAYAEGRKAYFGTNVYVKPSEWQGCEVVNRHDAVALNGMLAELLVRLQTIEIEVWRCGTAPTLQHLRQGWRRKLPTMNLLAFAEEVVSTSSREESTKENLLCTMRLFQRFRPTCLHELSYTVLRDFEHYLRERGNCQNTIVKHFHHLRTITKEAVKHGFLPHTALPFEQFNLHTERKEHVTLSEAELQRIAKVDIYPDVRDAFLFCCQTGLRYSDYVRLKDEHFRQRGSERWIELYTKKTGHIVRLPITHLSRLFGELGKHPSIPCNTVTNIQLRAIVEKAHIKKRVTFHCARHTFATLLLSKGVPITTVQALLGHSTLKMTQRYAEVKLGTILKDLHKASR